MAKFLMSVYLNPFYRDYTQKCSSASDGEPSSFCHEVVTCLNVRRLCVCVYVCMYVCMYVYARECVCVPVCLCMYYVHLFAFYA
jgi:hypothetical protein